MTVDLLRAFFKLATCSAVAVFEGPARSRTSDHCNGLSLDGDAGDCSNDNRLSALLDLVGLLDTVAVVIVAIVYLLK